MISLKKQKGFTIVELLIVMVIIAILATLVIVTFTGIQQKARNTQRETDINALDAHLEAYYAENGHYPSLTDLQTSDFVSKNMKGLDPSALLDPNTKNTVIQSTASATDYGYSVNTGGDTPASCETDDTTCMAFTLTADLEGGGTFVKSSNT